MPSPESRVRTASSPMIASICSAICAASTSGGRGGPQTADQECASRLGKPVSAVVGISGAAATSCMLVGDRLGLIAISTGPSPVRAMGLRCASGSESGLRITSREMVCTLAETSSV